MKTYNDWFEDYGKSHTNRTNKSGNKIYWVSVPLMFWGLMAILFQFKLAYIPGLKLELNAAFILLAIIALYYYTLSRTLWIGVFLAGLSSIAACSFFEQYINLPVW